MDEGEAEDDGDCGGVDEGDGKDGPEIDGSAGADAKGKAFVATGEGSESQQGDFSEGRLPTQCP